jgi:carboxyl-terminal processing protease
LSGAKGGLLLGLAIGLVLSLVFSAGFAAGTIFGHPTQSAIATSSDSDLQDFLTAYHLVTERSYFRPLNKHHLIYAAIDGMLGATGDPHTVFLSPHENSSANHEINGAGFSGIGAIVVPSQGNLEIVAPLPDTPSSRAGLRSGDLVTAIDGKSVSSMSGDSAVGRIHGRTGTTVMLTIKRGHQAPFVVRVRRGNIPAITAYGRMLSRHIGYIQIISFGDTTSREVKQAVRQVTKQGARAIVIDLRDNPGGYVDAAQSVASDFIAHGVVAYEEDSKKSAQPLPVLTGHQETRVPLAVLVNGGTASAAEIVAGALRDDLGSVLIGTRTYGKGSMQSVYALADGSSVRITDRLWLTPHKHSIQAVGLTPNIVVPPHLGDSQLSAAERYLTARLSR